MKGLITKDLLTLKQVVLTMGLLMVFYLFLGIMNMKSSGGGMIYFSIMAMVINVMVPLSCAGYDEQCGWEQFGASLPVSKNQIVASRYIVNLLVMCFTTFAVFVGNIILAALGGNSSGLTGYLLPIIATMIYVAIMNPIIYKFGVQKSRFIVIAIFLLPSMLIAGLGMFLSESSQEAFPFIDQVDKIGSLSSAQLIGAEMGAIVIAAVFYTLSMMLSMKIYKNKEL